MKNLTTIVISTLITSTILFGQQPELIIPLEDDAAICAFAFSPDGKLILSASVNELGLWDADTDRLIRRLGSHDFAISGIYFSPDGSSVITMDEYGYAKAWDLEDGTCRFSLKKKSELIAMAQIDPTQKTFAAVTLKGDIAIRDFETGRLIHTIHPKSKKEPLVYASYSSDGSLIAAVCQSQIELINVQTKKTVKNLITESSQLLSAEFSSDGRQLVSASDDNKINVWDIENGVLLYTIADSLEYLDYARFSPNGRKILSFQYNKLNVWDAARKNLDTSYEDLGSSFQCGHSYIPLDYSVRFDKDKISIYNLYADEYYGKSTAQIWSMSLNEPEHILESYTRTIDYAFLNSDKSFLTFYKGDYSNVFWNMSSGGFIDIADDSWVHDVFSCNRFILFYIGYSNGTDLWDAQTGKLIKHIDEDLKSDTKINFSQDEDRFALITRKNFVNIYNSENGQKLQSFSGDAFEITSTAWSPDGQMIALISSESRRVKICNSQTLDTLLTIEGNLVAWSKDSKLIASLAGNNILKIWDVADQSIVQVIDNEEETMRSFYFGEEGKYIITETGEKIMSWKIKDGKMIQSVKAPRNKYQESYRWSHDAYVEDGYFSPDGNFYLEYWGLWPDTYVLLWDLENKELIRSYDKTMVIDADWTRNVLITEKDNKISFWDIPGGKELISLVVIDTSDWIVFQPGGYFDASPGAMEKIYFVQGLQFADPAEAKELYYEPGLWQKVMRSRGKE